MKNVYSYSKAGEWPQPPWDFNNSLIKNVHFYRQKFLFVFLSKSFPYLHSVPNNSLTAVINSFPEIKDESDKHNVMRRLSQGFLWRYRKSVLGVSNFVGLSGTIFIPHGKNVAYVGSSVIKTRY